MACAREWGTSALGTDLKVELEHLFNGGALNGVDAKGRLSVPAFVRATIERRTAEKSIVLGKHEVDPCLVGYDASYKQKILAEINERKRADIERGGDPRAHHSRNRRAFITESCTWDSSGRIVLPPMMRRIAGIEDLVLFVGAGETFELWSPQAALDSGDADLAELAAYKLEERGLGA